VGSDGNDEVKDQDAEYDARVLDVKSTRVSNQDEQCQRFPHALRVSQRRYN
jgi:hypothetical protein